MSDIPAALLELLVCPACHGSLAWDYEASELVCSAPTCGLAYLVQGDIPVLLIEKARRP
ncbi:MAG: Trm112 family protein [Propionibacteriaceae bacterium]|nr:Trm112 family protein [Propionibacteriaceae bacterium]